jgi:hypothetical protein
MLVGEKLPSTGFQLSALNLERQRAQRANRPRLNTGYQNTAENRVDHR